MASNTITSKAPLFGSEQTFAVRRADQLLAKLRWDLVQLEQLRWDEELGDTWRRPLATKPSIVPCRFGTFPSGLRRAYGPQIRSRRCVIFSVLPTTTPSFRFRSQRSGAPLSSSARTWTFAG